MAESEKEAAEESGIGRDVEQVGPFGDAIEPVLDRVDLSREPEIGSRKDAKGVSRKGEMESPEKKGDQAGGDHGPGSEDGVPDRFPDRGCRPDQPQAEAAEEDEQRTADKEGVTAGVGALLGVVEVIFRFGNLGIVRFERVFARHRRGERGEDLLPGLRGGGRVGVLGQGVLARLDEGENEDRQPDQDRQAKQVMGQVSERQVHGAGSGIGPLLMNNLGLNDVLVREALL